MENCQIMATCVVCKNCGKKIRAERPKGDIQVEGDVTYRGTQFDGSSINFSTGSELNFGSGGEVRFTAPPKNLKGTCSICQVTCDYSISDIFDE